MMRRALPVLLFLLGPALAWGQVPPPKPDDEIVVGNELPPDKIAELEARIKADTEAVNAAKSKRRTVKLEPGEYQLVGVRDVKLPVKVKATTQDVVTVIQIDPGKPWTGFLRKKGDREPSVVHIESKDYLRWIIVGAKVGTTHVMIIENGTPEKTPPNVLAQINVTVGTPTPPKPPPPPPDADPLLKLAAADMAAGKGSQDDVDFYRSYLTTVANSLPSTVKYAKTKEFWGDFSAGVRDTIQDRLPSMRKAVGELLNQQVPEKEGDAFDAERRNKIAVILKAVASRLETK